jgi:hypothetical protein
MHGLEIGGMMMLNIKKPAPYLRHMVSAAK